MIISEVQRISNMIILRILHNRIRTDGLKLITEDKLNTIVESTRKNKTLLEKKTMQKEMSKRYIIVVAVVYIQTSTDVAFGQMLPSSVGNQGYFSPTLTAPTDSCHTFSPSEVSARYCGLVCLQHSRETYLYGVDYSKGLCACCNYPLLPKVQDTAWCSYQRKCPPYS